MDKSHYIEVAKFLYPDPELRNTDSYQPIIDHFGFVLLQVDDSNDYQGDTRVLYMSPVELYGYLQFGWGSCSFCDALQSCRTYEGLADLIQQLEAGVIWKPRDEMLKFFIEHDWEGDYSWSNKKQKQFINDVIVLLSSRKQ